MKTSAADGRRREATPRGKPFSRAALLAGSLLLGALLSTAPAARAGDGDFYISVPSLGAIYRLDGVTHQAEPFVTGLGIPFYGAWASDGFLYMPDRLFGIVFRISPTGVVTPFAGGGFIQAPVTVIEAPDGDLIVADIFSETIVRIGPTGQQTLIADNTSSGGLLSGPGGTAFGPDGTLYVANNINDTIVGVNVNTGDVWLVSSGNGLLSEPGGVAVDGAGNLFVCNYGTSDIVRVRLDTGIAEVFCVDPFIHNPNDLRLAREGGMHITMKNGALAHINALGQMTVVTQGDPQGAWDGVARPSDTPLCTGRYLPYGTGTPGSGGITPELSGIFSPCPGSAVALDFDKLLGGAPGALAWGLSPANLPFKGGRLLVDISAPGGLIPLFFPGSGAGGGGFVLPFTLPDDAVLSGFSFYLQALAKDSGAVGGVSLSNGLQELIGS